MILQVVCSLLATALGLLQTEIENRQRQAENVRDLISIKFVLQAAIMSLTGSDKGEALIYTLQRIKEERTLT